MSDLNYNIAPVNPMQGYMSALQTGAMIGGLRDEREKARAQEEAARLAAQQKAEKDAQIAEAYKTARENPSAENYVNLSNLVDPEMGKSIREGFALLTKDQQEAQLRDSVNLWSSFMSKKPELGIKMIEERLEGYKAAGNEAKVKETQWLLDMANVGEFGQEQVANTIGMITSLMPGGKEAMEAYNKFAENRRAEEMHPLKMQEELDKLKAERDPAQKLSESSMKLVNDSVIKAIDAGKSAEQYDNLASAYDALKPPSGWGAKGFEELKKVVGGQDILTALKQEYVKLRNTEALKNLPPGVASDKDIEVAMSAFPDETSNPELISSFMRGTAKLQRYTEQVEKAKAGWINQNGSLASARKDMEVNGIPVTEGTAFWDFTDAIEIPNIVKVGGPKTTASSTAAKAQATPAKVVEVDY